MLLIRHIPPLTCEDRVTLSHIVVECRSKKTFFCQSEKDPTTLPTVTTLCWRLCVFEDFRKNRWCVWTTQTQLWCHLSLKPSKVVQMLTVPSHIVWTQNSHCRAPRMTQDGTWFII